MHEWVLRNLCHVQIVSCLCCCVCADLLQAQCLPWRQRTACRPLTDVATCLRVKGWHQQCPALPAPGLEELQITLRRLCDTLYWGRLLSCLVKRRS